MSYDYLVIGAGLTGATFARLKADEGKRVLVIDRRRHVAGNAYDYESDEYPGMYIHKYGPHLFHTNSETVFQFLSQFTSWRDYEHRVVTTLRGCLIPLPFNFTSMEVCLGKNYSEVCKRHFSYNQRVTLSQLRAKAEQTPRDEVPNQSPDCARLANLARFVYQEVFLQYTRKMWELPLEELGPTVADRVPIVMGYDDRYFADRFQKMPALGYTQMVKSMLDDSNIYVEVGMDLDTLPKSMYEGARIFHTGSIDEYLNFAHGQLPYRSVVFDLRYPDRDDVWKAMGSTRNYVNDEPRTRTTSMARINGRQPKDGDISISETPHTPLSTNERYYPIPTQANRDLYAKYEETIALSRPDIRFGGRLGSYQYLNMDQAVAQAMKAAKEF